MTENQEAAHSSYGKHQKVKCWTFEKIYRMIDNETHLKSYFFFKKQTWMFTNVSIVKNKLIDNFINENI